MENEESVHKSPFFLPYTTTGPLPRNPSDHLFPSGVSTLSYIYSLLQSQLDDFCWMTLLYLHPILHHYALYPAFPFRISYLHRSPDIYASSKYSEDTKLDPRRSAVYTYSYPDIEQHPPKFKNPEIQNRSKKKGTASRTNQDSPPEAKRWNPPDRSPKI